MFPSFAHLTNPYSGFKARSKYLLPRKPSQLTQPAFYHAGSSPSTRGSPAQRLHKLNCWLLTGQGHPWEHRFLTLGRAWLRDSGPPVLKEWVSLYSASDPGCTCSFLALPLLCLWFPFCPLPLLFAQSQSSLWKTSCHLTFFFIPHSPNSCCVSRCSLPLY